MDAFFYICTTQKPKIFICSCVGTGKPYFFLVTLIRPKFVFFFLFQFISNKNLYGFCNNNSISVNIFLTFYRDANEKFVFFNKKNASTTFILQKYM